MGIVAVDADDVVTGRDLMQRGGLAALLVAGTADDIALYLQQRRIGGAVRLMAGQAFAHGNRTVDESPLDEILVADKTELIFGCGDKAAVGGLVVAAVALLVAVGGVG